MCRVCTVHHNQRQSRFDSACHPRKWGLQSVKQIASNVTRMSTHRKFLLHRHECRSHHQGCIVGLQYKWDHKHHRNQRLFHFGSSNYRHRLEWLQKLDPLASSLNADCYLQHCESGLQYVLAQSELTSQTLRLAQGAQVLPPQSASVSSWFKKVSLQD
jgi:hypothetical protein